MKSFVKELKKVESKPHISELKIKFLFVILCNLPELSTRFNTTRPDLLTYASESKMLSKKI